MCRGGDGRGGEGKGRGRGDGGEEADSNICNNLSILTVPVYSRTSLTRGFWEEINRAKKPRTVEVPRVREVSYLSPIFWCYVLTCTNTIIQLPYLDVSRFFKLIFIMLLLPVPDLI